MLYIISENCNLVTFYHNISHIVTLTIYIYRNYCYVWESISYKSYDKHLLLD